MNALTDAQVITGDRLFETLDTTTRGLSLPDGRKVLLSDTVGFIRKLPHHLVEAFKSTLEEVKEADLLIHVADGSSPVLNEEIATVNSVLKELGASRKPTILAINKIDKISSQSGYLRGYDREKTVQISALKGLNLDKLLKMICDLLPSTRQFAQLLIPYDDGQVLDEIHQNGLVYEIEYKDFGVEVKGSIEKAILKKYEEYVIK